MKQEQKDKIKNSIISTRLKRQSQICRVFEIKIDYSHLNIQGYALGAKGLPTGIVGNSDTAYADMRQALHFHPNFQPALDIFALWGISP